MKTNNCPNGSGDINIRFNYSDAVELLKHMDHVVSAFSWDEYIMEMMRNSLREGIVNEDARRQDENITEEQSGADDEDGTNVEWNYPSFDLPSSSTAPRTASQVLDQLNIEDYDPHEDI
jgi:hypothetical protein